MKKILITGAMALALSATSALAATNRKSEARVEPYKSAVTQPATTASENNQTAQTERRIRRERRHHRMRHRHTAHWRRTHRRNA